MKIKKIFQKAIVTTSLLCIAGISQAEDFKRFSVSSGWLHMSSMGKAQPFRINTSVGNGTKAAVGVITGQTILNNVDQSRIDAMNPDLISLLNAPSNEEGRYLFDDLLDVIMADDPTLIDQLTGIAEINGIANWSADAGLEVEDVDTLGMMFTYNVTDNVAVQLIAGIPPKVDLKGKGTVYAPFSATSQPLQGLVGDLYLKNNLLITDLDSYNTAASARAWTPAIQAQYYFGKSGVNKFRPFVGAGLMYAYFNEIEINSGIENDLIRAGHMIQNIHDGKAGASLEGKPSSGNMKVKVDATDTIAPIVTAGFTYDFKQNWFATASISYAKLDNTATITVLNTNNNAKLIQAKTKIEIDPLITYLGVGYRF
ncbi:OmpW family protein [Acinetobacter sp. I-MWF]|uniref:OmpW/AlkL family protein n=1 Tax=Acinetobacter TaxID=469 RepID=UPI0021C5E7A5|nr:OmpW family outer membrane protein [Acinetobacter sp. I-MWF]MCT9978478.1 OmpW family protein [Acinetobacter sp. I-MWF]